MIATQPTLERQVYNVDEVANALAISQSMVHKLRRQGSLRTIKIGDRVLIPVEELERYLGRPIIRSGR